MAKDLVSALGSAELNALMAVQVNKLATATSKLYQLFERNGCQDFNAAYEKVYDAAFIDQRNTLMDEIASIMDTIDKLRSAQVSAQKRQ